MPEQRSVIVKPLPANNKSKGDRKDVNLRASFPNSPIHNGELTDEERKKAFQELVLDGTVLNGHGINSFSRDYKDAPNLEEVETGGGGLPSTPYTPNLVSPGPGSVNAADQIEYTGELPEKEFRNNFGSGKGGLVSPSETSEELSKTSVLKAYISGKSYLGSDGKA